MRSLIRATLTAAALLFFVHLGSGSLASDRHLAQARVGPYLVTLRGAVETFTATAYCQRGTTRSGVNTRTGIVAADPDHLPVGSVVQIDTPARQYAGIYTVLDTGAKVQGPIVDLFIRDCREALRFGRQPVHVQVIRKGWSPRASK